MTHIMRLTCLQAVNNKEYSNDRQIYTYIHPVQLQGGEMNFCQL